MLQAWRHGCPGRDCSIVKIALLEVVAFAKEKIIGLVVIGPEAPLVVGVAERCSPGPVLHALLVPAECGADGGLKGVC